MLNSWTNSVSSKKKCSWNKSCSNQERACSKLETHNKLLVSQFGCHNKNLLSTKSLCILLMKGQNWTSGPNLSLVQTKWRWNSSMCYCKNVHYKPMDGINALKRWENLQSWVNQCFLKLNFFINAITCHFGVNAFAVQQQ